MRMNVQPIPTVSDRINEIRHLTATIRRDIVSQLAASTVHDLIAWPST